MKWAVLLCPFSTQTVSVFLLLLLVLQAAQTLGAGAGDKPLDGHNITYWNVNVQAIIHCWPT